MAGSSTVADLVGRVLAGRYRLLGAIGSGASGRVYVADDVRLRRRVAVKVLHAGLADDAGFLRRFRSEAQLAASLHHPNVMAVYDWGEDGVPFMVLELLVGGSLRHMLDAGTRLSPAQAAHVSGQVAAALDYAHSRGLVHRDIKPANLLFDEHGIVRVADFGLARALAEASWTEPAGAVVGTARYAAPEQGSGAALDGRADLYALGLVVVEAVTGSVPLVADTALGTVGLRQEQAISVPDEIGSLVPVVERACRVEPADRFASADEMRRALADAAEALPPPGPLALAGLGAVADDPHPTQVVTARTEAPLFDQDQKPATTRRLPLATPVSARPSRSAAPFMLGVVIAVALSALGFVLAQPSPGAAQPVPLLVGMSRADAQQEVSGKGFLFDIERRRADDPRGTVVAQVPAAGGFRHEGDTIRLIVSTGPKLALLPELRGKTVEEATALLQDQFAVKVEEDWNDTYPAGQVVDSNPQGSAPPDSFVVLLVSKGPQPVAVPNVARLSYDRAAKALTDVSLKPVQVEVFDNAVEAGKVVGTDPAVGTQVEKNSSVNVLVSKGPDLVMVPNFKGQPIATVTLWAEQSGVALTTEGTIAPGRLVVAQDIDPNTMVPRGTTVRVFF